MTNNSKKQQKRGRKPSVSDEKLEEMLLQFIKVFPIEKLNPSQLAKHTNINRQVWRRRMGEKIEELKKPHFDNMGGKGNKKYVPIPNIAEIVDTHWDNKVKLIASLQMYENTIQEFYEDAKAYQEQKEKNAVLIRQLDELQSELKLSKSNESYYKQKYQEVSILSKSPAKRETKNLKNVLDINSKKALSTDFTNDFPGLFDD